MFSVGLFYNYFTAMRAPPGQVFYDESRARDDIIMLAEHNDLSDSTFDFTVGMRKPLRSQRVL